MSVLPVVTVAVMVMVRAVFVAVLLVAAMATITITILVLIPMISMAVVVVVVVVVPFILVGPRAIWRHKLPRGKDRGRGVGNPRAGPRLCLSHLSLHGGVAPSELASLGMLVEAARKLDAVVDVPLAVVTDFVRTGA
jgi:hypothetical protein